MTQIGREELSRGRASSEEYPLASTRGMVLFMATCSLGLRRNLCKKCVRAGSRVRTDADWRQARLTCRRGLSCRLSSLSGIAGDRRCIGCMSFNFLTRRLPAVSGGMRRFPVSILGNNGTRRRFGLHNTKPVSDHLDMAEGTTPS